MIDERARAEMRRILAEVRSGAFAKEFIAEGRTNTPALKRARAQLREDAIEVTGVKLRAMMKWLGKKKLVDRAKN